MRGTVAKRLRKEVGFVKNKEVVIDGEFNLRIGSGAAARVVIVSKSKPALTAEENKDKLKEYEKTLAAYKAAKSEYKSK